MCVCMCVYVCACMCMCACARVHVYTVVQVGTCVHVYACAHVYIHVCAHVEARGPLHQSLVGWFCCWPSAVFPPSRPRPCAQALLSAPAPPGQRLADVTMSSWGGVSWQVPHLPGAVAGACHSPGPGALVISLLAFSPVRRQLFELANSPSITSDAR